ncbi:MAG: HlyD family efflux transporter periplasmic adaptor subunit [Bacteroidota bacterium]
MRKIILAVLGLVLIAGAFYLASSLISSNSRKRPPVPKEIKTVFIDTVVNKTIPITINANGSLTAQRKIEIYSEVQGVFNASDKAFKPGEKYRRGQLLLGLDGREYYSSLVAQRSSLFDLITSIMPDLRLDYQDAFQKWQDYLLAFNINKPVAKLPEPTSDKERFFITGKQVISTYYVVKNMEERYAKYNIRAPFTGVLTETLVNPGTLVRSGQKLGEFIDPEIFELAVNVNVSFSDLLKVGKQVALNDIDNNRTWQGKVIRVNERIDQSTQTITVFIQVAGEGLKEGMYLEARLRARDEENAIEVPRKLLIDERQLFTLKDSVLHLIDVQPVYFTDRTAVLKGVENGTLILERAVPGAYEGMLVKPYQEKAAQ